jgi:hypothetical protein
VGLGFIKSLVVNINRVYNYFMADNNDLTSLKKRRRLFGWLCFITFVAIISLFVAGIWLLGILAIVLFFIFWVNFGGLIQKIDSIEKPEKTKKSRKKVKNQTTPGIEKTIFHIKYVDYEGNESSRDIEINSFLEENGKLSIYAYCYLRKEMRQFLVDRIVSISIQEGDPFDNPQQFLWDKYKKQV